MNEGQNHWTSNQELVEDFVLGRLPADKVEELTRHLSTCGTCRAAVDRERLIVAGTRRLGRDALKARIAARVGAPRRSEIPWPHVVSIAAVLVLALGLTIFSIWIGGDLIPEDELAQKTAIESADSVGRQAGASGRVGAQREITAEEETMPRSETLSGIKIEGQKDRSRADVEEPAEVSAAAAPAKRDQRKGELADDIAPIQAEVTHVPEQLWVQAVILPTESEEKAKDEDAAAEETLQLRKRQNRPAAASEGLRQVPQAEFALRQKPVVELPPTQKNRQHSLAPNTVETLLEKFDGQVRMTIFTDESIDEVEMTNATVQAVGADSLIVFVGSQQIALKIPPSWNVFQGAQTPPVR